MIAGLHVHVLDNGCTRDHVIAWFEEHLGKEAFCVSW